MARLSTPEEPAAVESAVAEFVHDLERARTPGSGALR